jgi:hypothetical protein
MIEPAEIIGERAVPLLNFIGFGVESASGV